MDTISTSASPTGRQRRRYRLKPSSQPHKSHKLTMVFMGLILLALLASIGVIAATAVS